MITASIVTYNHKLTDIEPTLKSLIDSIVDEIYIIDHSEDKSVLRNALEGYSSRIQYIEHENLGYGNGHNIALRLAQKKDCRYHIVINPDVWFDGSIIADIQSYMDNHHEVGHLMPLVKYPDGSIQRLCRLLPTPSIVFARYFLPLLIKKQNHIHELGMTDYKHAMNVPFLSGCFMFFRMDAINDVGLFDERFFLYAEDIDITRRIHQKYVTLYYPEVSIYHKFSRASSHNLRLFYIHVKSLVQYFNKWGWFFDKERQQFNKRLLDSL